MCNAHNHSPDCTCGWGGAEHSGRRLEVLGHQLYSWIQPIKSSVESYTCPNARCPVCGATVYFYSSPSGGRVFFDELGPPWPKHPCTSQVAASKMPTPNPVRSVESKGAALQWVQDGWVPVLVNWVYRLDQNIIRVEANYMGEPIELYVLSPQKAINKLTKDCLWQGRKLDDRYELSIVTESGSIYKGYGFLSDTKARSLVGYTPQPQLGQNRVAKSTKRKPTKLTKSKKRPLKRTGQSLDERPLPLKKVRKQKPKKKPKQKRIENPAMKLALEQAIIRSKQGS